MRSDTARVLTEAVRLVQEARMRLPRYAGRRAPIHGDELARLVVDCDCHLSFQPIDGGSWAWCCRDAWACTPATGA